MTSPKKVTLHKKQSEPVRWLFSPAGNDKLRFAVVPAARGFGKSWLGATVAALCVQELESLPQDVENKRIAIICATLDQAEQIYFSLLYYVFNLGQVAKIKKKPSLRFTFPNRTELTCWSADAYERLRGTGQYLVVADEITSWKVKSGSVKDAWESVIEPCIVTRWSPEQSQAVSAPSPGRALIISTVKGRDYFYDMTLRADKDPRWKVFTYTYRDSPLLSKKDIEDAKENSDPLSFSREYECDFGESGLSVFHQFNRKEHVLSQDTDIPYFDKDEPVHASIDFNIMLNCTTFHAIRDDKVYALDEFKGAKNTEDLAKTIRAKFPDNPIICYPDPTGRYKSTKAPTGQTDFTILRSHGFRVCARKALVSVVDSAAAVNRKLKDAHGNISYYVHPRCYELIQSFERTVWSDSTPDSAKIDKKHNIEHFSDGVRYFIEFKWPIRKGKLTVISSSDFF